MAGKTHTIHKEMGYTKADFLRLLPKALADEEFRLDNDRVIVGNGLRRLIVEIGPESERRLGNFRLPRLQVTLSFSNYDEIEIESLLDRFWRTYQKGGG